MYFCYTSRYPVRPSPPFPYYYRMLSKTGSCSSWWKNLAMILSKEEILLLVTCVIHMPFKCHINTSRRTTAGRRRTSTAGLWKETIAPNYIQNLNGYYSLHNNEIWGPQRKEKKTKRSQERRSRIEKDWSRGIGRRTRTRRRSRNSSGRIGKEEEEKGGRQDEVTMRHSFRLTPDKWHLGLNATLTCYYDEGQQN